MNKKTVAEKITATTLKAPVPVLTSYRYRLMLLFDSLS
jgi:hypothetical protein